jgi:hypothetical protein
VKPERPVREAPVRLVPEQRPVAEPPMVREQKPEVAPDSATAKPERRRPNPRADADSSDDRPEREKRRPPMK